VPASPAAAVADPLPAGFVEQIKAAGSDLAGVSLLEPLTETVPGFGTNPGMLLGLHEAFGALNSLGSLADTDALATAIDALDGEGFTFGNVQASVTAGVATLSFDLSAARQAPAPLAISTDAVGIAGATFDVDVTMPATTITMQFDPSIGAAADAFAITGLPTLSLSATLAANVSEQVQFGFADATATGTANLNTSVGVELVDPDASGRLTGTELAGLAVEDVVDLHLAASAPDDVDVDLSLTADVAGSEFGGTLTVSDASLFADPEAVIDVSGVGANPIDLLGNISAESALTSLSQLISSLGLAMSGGDVKLPFLADGVFIPGNLGDDAQEGFNEVYKVIQPIIDYVEPRAAGQIVCGTLVPDAPSPDEDGLPFGSVRNLESGDTVYCRAFTADEGAAGTWSVASANATAGSAVANSIGKSPTRNQSFTMDDDGEFEASATYTPTGGSLTQIVARPDTIQELVLELEDADLIPADSTDYDADLESFEFPIGTSVAGPITRDVSIDAGSSLVAGTGLTGLSADAGAQASLEISGIDAGITLGLITTEDEADINPADNGTNENAPGPGDRFYVRTDGPVLEVDDVSLDGDLSMVGRLGFLEVDAVASGSLSSPESDPALAVSLPPATGVTVGANSDPDATLVRDLLRNFSPDDIDADIDLLFSGDIDVTSTVPGASLTGSIGVEWDLNDASPTLDTDVDFEQNLFPFEGDQSLTHDGPADADETLFTADGGGLMAMAGLAGSQLVDPDTGAVCNVTSVLSDTTLRCENPEPDDGDPDTDVDQNPITFADGVEYRIAGNTLAYLVEILDAIDGLADYIEDAIGDTAFTDPLPVVGVSPAEIVDQVQKLRDMVDEFRGVQDGQITCSVEEEDAADIRAIPIADPGGTATLNCHATATAADVSQVRWRITGDGQSNNWVTAADETVGAGPETVELTVTAPNTGHDGFLSLGDEYAIEVEWLDGTETQNAALPPRTPQSLQSLAEEVSQVLGLPAGALEFELVDAADDDLRTLRINLGYGICSAPAPANTSDCSGMPTTPAPEANLELDLGDSLPALIGFETTGTLDVRFAALGQFDIGIPLDGDEPVLYGSTGLEARIEVNGTDLGVTASLGPVGAVLGSSAGGITGTVEGDSDSTLTDDEATFTLQNAPVGATVVNTTTDEECFITARTDSTNLECALDWDEGDEYQIGGQSELHAGLSFELNVADSGGVLTSTESVPITDAEFETTDLDEFLAGDAECGGIDPNSDEVVDDGGPAGDDTDLSGILCARLSMALTIGNAQAYLGELGVDLDAPGLTIFVPNDLDQRIADAVLDPSFIVLAIPGLLAEVEDGLRDAADSGAPAAIADPLRAGADAVGVLREGAETIAEPLSAALAGLSDLNDISSTIESELTDFLTGAGVDVEVTVEMTCVLNDPCDPDAGDTLLDVIDIRALLTFGQEVVEGTGVNLGLEGLPLSVEGGVEAFANWSITAGAGVSYADGPYIALDPDENELGVEAGVRFNDEGPDDCAGPIAESVDEGDYTEDRCLRGRLAFLFITAIDEADPGSNISANIGFDVTGSDPDRITLQDIVGGDVDVAFNLGGQVHLAMHFRTGIGEDVPDIPSILGTFQLDWEVALGDPIEAPTVSFDNLHLDLGTFLTGFLGPIASEVKNITGPIQPIIDVLMAPIPVVSDLAQLVGSPPITMISLLEAATGADLSLVKAIAAFLTFFNGIAGLDDDSIQIPLGGIVNGLTETERNPGKFSVDAAAGAKTVSHTEAAKLIKQDSNYAGGSGFTNDVAGSTGLAAPGKVAGRPATFGVPGLSFPFLDDAGQIFGLLVGQDATIIRWDAGTLEAKAGFSYDFGPIMVGPVPITITIGGEVGVRGRFAIGYDTSGIRQLLDGGSGVALFDGIFIDDLDAKGNDVPEITFFGKVFAGAAVDLVIISAGVRGGIELTFSLDLDDRPDPDGKLRIMEIVDKLQNPICLFVVSGKIEAFLDAFVKIDLFFFTEEFSFNLIRITLLEWSSACEPPTPNLADADSGVLYLNVGDRAQHRNIAEDQIDDKLEVRQIGDGKVRVSGYGWEETHEGVELIVADGGKGPDELLFLPGTEEGSDGSGEEDDTPFTIPVVVSGGPGDDIIKTGDGADKVFGDAAIAAGSWAGKNYNAITAQSPDSEDGDNADQLETGIGDDLVYGGAGDDAIDTGFGEDTAFGEGGNDELKGGPGDDALDGGADIDSIQGGPIKKPSGTPDDDDGIAGGSGDDVVAGDLGNDVVFGDGAGSGFFSDIGDGRLTFSTPTAGTWRDTWCPDGGGGSPGNDILTGTDGDDWIAGGGGNDKIDAGVGDDHACGGPNDDEVVGFDGDDELRGDADQDVLTGGEDDDLVYGGTGNDRGTGDNGDDDMFGDDGADIFEGNVGDDVIVGDGGSVADATIDGVGTGTAIDVAKVQAVDGNTTRASTSSNARRADCSFNAAATGNSDCLYGGSGSDAIFGGSDGDFGYGESGADLLEGNDGPDELRGGTEDDLLFGSGGTDDLYGEGGNDEAFGDRTIAAWVTDTPSAGVEDHIFGGPDPDRLEGDGGGDDIFGGAANDHAEGNDGDDSIFGEGGNDDLIGGSDKAGVTDVGETLVSGGEGNDVITGDNATIVATGYVLGRTVTLLDLTIGGGDTIEGDAGTDAAFGQVGDDVIWGDHGTVGPIVGAAANDYLEGDNGDDTIRGEAGTDDIVGGGSAADGVIDADRDGTDLADTGETLLDGGAARDWMAGDNTRMDRVLGNGLDYPDADVTPIKLFDVNSANAGASGGDNMTGGDGDDLMFGQGNGSQGNQSDPEDDADNDGDGAVDEDAAAWLGDTMLGNAGDDYVEGNHGSDFLSGGDNNDDLIGGGSAIDGVIDSDRTGNGLFDARDTLHGDAGADVEAGDNARIDAALSGPLWLTDPRAVILFDVNSATTALSGGDYVSGEDGDDVQFGQGNGAQNPAQSDPLDGYDNDLDGRESPASTEYDCFDGANNDGAAGVDAADPQCLAAIDEDKPWDGDIILGGNNEDYAEGNHGADWIFGNDGQDDLIGGGSALDGVIDADRSGVGLNDVNDVIHGNESHDVIAGDNATVDKVAVAGAWSLVDGATGSYNLLKRNVSMATTPEAAGRFGNDHLLGDAGHDQLYGQQGNDLIEGNADDDGVIGDLGKFTTSVETGNAQLIQPSVPFIRDYILAAGSITHLTELYAQDTGGGNDIILGGQGHDDLHGGPGNDFANGDLYTPADPPDPDLRLRNITPSQYVWDNPDVLAARSPLADEDAIFGGFGNDVMWGGRGPDHLYGGHGADFLDVRPRPATQIKKVTRPADPPSWYTWTRLPNGLQESYQDSDVIYGGWGPDALQANLALNGPNNGDRLFDWAGVHNIFYVCASTYGDWTATRALEPGLPEFFTGLSRGDGLLNPATPGSSGFLELGFVYTADQNANSNPPHPETPGNFYCGNAPL
jgi:Ca2+-binding RTX toxin-like protein